jgi:Sulfotransferase domain
VDALGAEDVFDSKTMIAAYQRHNDAVRAQVSPARLMEWRPADGWAPIAATLDLPVPAEPFPCVNTRAQFRLPDFGVRPETAGG